MQYRMIRSGIADIHTVSGESASRVATSGRRGLGGNGGNGHEGGGGGGGGWMGGGGGGEFLKCTNGIWSIPL